jgi:hypothetical protein
MLRRLDYSRSSYFLILQLGWFMRFAQILHNWLALIKVFKATELQLIELEFNFLKQGLGFLSLSRLQIELQDID